MKSARWWGMVLGVLVVSRAYADHIFVSGDVTGTWVVDTVFVTGEIRVPPAGALVIEPGVKVLFQAACKFIVDSAATLQAVGVEGDSVSFDTSGVNSWKGIKFLHASPESGLEYCIVQQVVDYDSVITGGGILCDYSSPTVKHCLIQNCQSSWGGGIACINGSAPEIGYCTIRHCGESGYGLGGGIYCEGGSDADINHNFITENSAHMGGGGIYCKESNPVIYANTISQNWSCGFSAGGGIYCFTSNALIQYNTLLDNEAGVGANISCEYSDIQIYRNTIQQSTVYGGIGSIYLHHSAPTISNNVILGSGRDSGTGIYCESLCAPVVENCLIAGHSGYGGGIVCMGGVTIAITNSTIVDNVGWVHGGVSSQYNANLTIINCIIWGNTPDQIFLDSTISSAIIYSDIEGGWQGIGNLQVYPDFTSGSLSDYQLGLSSPCIDAGHPDPQYNDPEDPANPGYALWPALGTIRNDMGAYGGSGASGWVGVVQNPSPSLPSEFRLDQNFPNPFKAATVIGFELPVASFVKLAIFDISGRRVSGSGTTPATELVNGWRQAGRHEVTFDGSNLSSGVYIYRLQAGDYSATAKMVLLK